MTRYRRRRVRGGTYFFTVALAHRRSAALTQRIDVLRQAYVATRRKRPFCYDAMVVLPYHVHAIWTLPSGDSDFSTRWWLIKSRFTQAVFSSMGAQHSSYATPSYSKRRKGERGLWQRRFWEHCIRDQADLDLHLRYCWLNPVKHGYVTKATNWPYTSLHRGIQFCHADPYLSGPIPNGKFGEKDGSFAPIPNSLSSELLVLHPLGL